MSQGTKPISVLESKRDAIVLALQKVPEFNLLTQWNQDGSAFSSSIIPKQKGDFTSALEEALNRTGLSITVAITGADEAGSQSIRAYLQNVGILISIAEFVTQNQDVVNGGTGMGALYLAERVLAGLNLLEIEGDKFVIVPREKNCIEDVTDAKSMAAGYYLINVHFTTKATVPVRGDYILTEDDRIIVDETGNPIIL